MNPGLERTSQLVPFETSTCPGSLPLVHGSHVSFVAHPTISNIALSCEWRFTSDRVTPRLPGWSTWHGYGIQQALLATRYL